MEKCSECGYIHPPSSGGCPIARNAKRNESKKGKAITDMLTKLTDYLHSSDNWKIEVDRIKGMFGI